jgi:Transposase
LPATALVAALRGAGRPVYAINPMAVARYRDRHTTSRGKSDHADAVVLANILRTDAHVHRALLADTPLARAVAVLARAHQDATWRRPKTLQELRAVLREYHPGFLQAFGASTTNLASADAAAASRAPAASLRDRHTPTLDRAPTRRGFAPTRRTGWSSQTGFFLIWQSMTAQVNGFLPSQEPCLWCRDGNRSLRSSREELVAHPLRGASTSSRWWLATLLEIVLSCFDLLVRELQSDFTSSGTLCRGWLYLPAVVTRPPVIVLAHGFSLTHSFHFWHRAEAYAAGSRLQLRPAVHRWQRW